MSLSRLLSTLYTGEDESGFSTGEERLLCCFDRGMAPHGEEELQLGLASIELY